MKSFFLTLFFFLSFTVLLHAEEHYFRFQINTPAELDRITRLISIDDVRGQTVFAYANEQQWEAFRQLGYKYRELPHPGSLYDHRMSANLTELRDWNSYPTYQAYVQMMQQFASTYPTICKLDTFGYSVQGRMLLSLIISDSVNTEEAEPEFFYTSTMHGDETVGYVLLLRLADYLLTHYGDTTSAEGRRVTRLVNNMEIWINPLFNPDGTYYGGNNTVTGARRYNAHGADLNRNFPDRIANPINSPAGREPETQAMMALAAAHNFTLSANFHGGAQVVNYPWDNGAPSGSYSASPDDAWYIKVSKTYASPNPDLLNGGFPYGITNGCQWYLINGGRQDWMYYFEGGREVTIELWNTKNPPGSTLPARWTNNKESFLAYMEEALRGIRGTVTDAETGQPLSARIDVTGYPDVPVYTDPDRGDFYRLVLPGSYTLIVSAPHYLPDTLSNIAVVDSPATVVNVHLQPRGHGFVAGTIFLADTTDYAGVSVTIENQTVLTNADGYFEFPPVFAGSLTIQLNKDGYVPASLNAVLPEGDSLWVEATLYPSAGSVLLIDDDGGKRTLPGGTGDKAGVSEITLKSPGTAADIFQTNLEAAGYQVVRESATATNPVNWSQYALLVWSSGANTSPISSVSLQNGLMNYVNGGGKLIMEGGEIGYDFRNNSTFKSSVLHITNWVADNSGNLIVQNTTHPITQSLPPTLPLNYTSYGDQDAVTPEATADLLIRNAGQSGTGGAILGGNVLFLAFNIAAIDGGDAGQLIRNAAAFLQPVSHPQHDLALLKLRNFQEGMFAPADSALSFTALLRNYGDQPVPPGTAVQLSLSAGNALSELQGSLNDSLAPGDTAAVDLGSWAAPDTLAEWHIRVQADSSGDEVPANNSANYRLVSLSSAVNFSEDFEDGHNGWQIISSDTTPAGSGWQIAAWPAAFGHRAASVLPAGNGDTQEEWLISPPLAEPGTLYFYWDYGAEWVTGNQLMILAAAGDSSMAQFTDTLLVLQEGDSLPGNGFREMQRLPLDSLPVRPRFIAFVYRGTNGRYWALDNIAVTTSPNAIAGRRSGIPETFRLLPNFPNPFNPATNIQFALPAPGLVTVSFYNTLGQQVAEISRRFASAGFHTLRWQPRNLASGIYFYRVQVHGIKAGELLYSGMGKLLLIK